jgi:mannose/cellobiose epimerase-like protein (N-acyl-D-glucosamine 2-epimerase family)
MSEIVERVARAICEASGEPWDASSDGYRDICVGFARAAILAMREPTPEMCYAALRVRYTEERLFDQKPTADSRLLGDEERAAIGFNDCLLGNPSKWCAPTWRSMIAEALR